MADTGDKKWRALTGISILSFVGFIDYSLVNTILPGIQRDLSATVDQLQWVMNVFFMMLAMFMVTMGRLGDIYGRRRVFYTAVFVFGAASLTAGASPTPEILIACRTVQGIAGAAIFTCAAALVSFHFPANEQGRAMGMFMSITGLGLAIGPVLGGFFMSALSWRWAFYVNVPVVILGFCVAYGAVRDTPRQTGQKIDWPGLTLLVPGLGLLVTAITKSNEWGLDSPDTLTFFFGGLALLAAFYRVEHRVADPIVDFQLLKKPAFVAGIVAGLALGVFIGWGNFLAPLYLLNVQNYAPYLAGFMLIPISLFVVLVPPLVGKPADKYGALPFICAGQLCFVAAALVELHFNPASPAWFVLIGLAFAGLGWGFQQSTMPTAVTTSAPPEKSGLAIGTLWTFWNVGAAIGIAVGGYIFEVLDSKALLGALARENITMSAHDMHIVRSLLSDPSHARDALAELHPGLEAKIFPLFQDAFMSGFVGSMWFLLAVTAFTAGFIGYMLWRGRSRKM